jgi:hypothetical protein
MGHFDKQPASSDSKLITPFIYSPSSTDTQQKIFLFVVFICFLLALVSISFYILYSRSVVSKSDMMIENSSSQSDDSSNVQQSVQRGIVPVNPDTKVGIVTVDSINNKSIQYSFWSVTIPTNWDYMGCENRGDVLYVGEVIQNTVAYMNLTPNRLGSCAFDGYPPDITIIRTERIVTPVRNSVKSPENEFPTTVSNIQETTVANHKAIIQKEITEDGPGRGSYWVAYIYLEEGMDIIRLGDVKDTSKKLIFDNLLSSLLYPL